MKPIRVLPGPRATPPAARVRVSSPASCLTSGPGRIRCCVAQIKNIRDKRPKKKFRIPAGVVQWGIVGVVAVVLVVLVVGALTRPPAEPAPIPVLSSSHDDLISITRMLGDVKLDSGTYASIAQRLGGRLLGPDTLFRQRHWYEALTALGAMLRGATGPESAAIRAYMAFCDYEADSLDRSLQHFRKSLAADSSPTEFAARLRFSIGWLFQSRGFQDSAVAYYAVVRQSLPDSLRLLKVLAANNAGVAYEVLRDTAAAGTALRQAAALIDTAAFPKETKTIRENLGRLTARR